MKIFINAGHTPQIEIDAKIDNDCGATGHGLQENIVAKSVADLLETELKNFGFQVVGNFQSHSLYAITDKANVSGADAFISLHCNAASSAAKGTETFYCKGSSTGKKIATVVQKNIVAAMGTVDRGVKDDTQTQHSRIHVLRKTKMPAILIELAFISNSDDAILLRNYQWRFANSIAKGLAEYYGITPSPDIVDKPADKQITCPHCKKTFTLT